MDKTDPKAVNQIYVNVKSCIKGSHLCDSYTINHFYYNKAFIRLTPTYTEISVS